MRLLVLAIGAPRDPHMASLIRDYETRAGRYFRFEALEVTAAAGGGRSAAQVREAQIKRLKRAQKLALAEEAGDH